MHYAQTFSFFSSAQYQSDEDEQFEMEPMDTMFEELSASRYSMRSYLNNSMGKHNTILCLFLLSTSM